MDGIIHPHANRSGEHDPIDVIGIRMAAKSLPLRLRSAYELRYLKGRSIRESADSLAAETDLAGTVYRRTRLANFSRTKNADRSLFDSTMTV